MKSLLTLFMKLAVISSLSLMSLVCRGEPGYLGLNQSFIYNEQIGPAEAYHCDPMSSKLCWRDPDPVRDCANFSMTPPGTIESNFYCNKVSGVINPGVAFSYLDPSKPYNTSAPCTISIRLTNSQGGGGVKLLKGTTQLITGMYAVELALWVRESSDCRKDLLSLGDTWGITTNNSTMYTAVHGYRIDYAYQYCLYVNESPIDCDLSRDPPLPPPLPMVVCSIITDNEIDLGVVNSANLSSIYDLHDVGISCTGAATVVLALNGGSAVSNALEYPLGQQMIGRSCFTANGGVLCDGDGYVQYVTVQSQSTTQLLTVLRGTGVAAGEYNASIVLTATVL